MKDVIKGIWSAFFGTAPNSKPASEEADVQPFFFAKDHAQDYVEAKVRYARSVLEHIDGGRP